MKQGKFLLSLSVIGFFALSVTFGFTNITENDLQAIVDQVNTEIEKEITIVDLNVQDTGNATSADNNTTASKTCSIEEPCSQDELATAITTLHGYGVTKYDTPETFMADQNIRRDEVLKMFYVFAQKTNQLPTVDTTRMCQFDDLDEGHLDIAPMIKPACQHGLFKGSNGKFMPTQSLTNAQAVIVLIRMIDGYKDETNVDHYATNYMIKAEALGLLHGLNISDKTQRDIPAKRSTVAMLLYRADK